MYGHRQSARAEKCTLCLAIFLKPGFICATVSVGGWRTYLFAEDNAQTSSGDKMCPHAICPLYVIKLFELSSALGFEISGHGWRGVERTK